jgi:hypothetical protein
MSKAELFQQLETLTREDLDELSDRVQQLRFGEEEDDLLPEDKAILERRVAEYKKNPNDVVDLNVVVDELLKQK